MQSVTTVLALGEWEYAGHPMHCDVPVNTLYVPAPHGAQVPPSGPEYPALQVQIELPSGELESGEQPRHVDASEAPTAVEYLPAAHAVHAANPDDAV